MSAPPLRGTPVGPSFKMQGFACWPNANLRHLGEHLLAEEDVDLLDVGRGGKQVVHTLDVAEDVPAAPRHVGGAPGDVRERLEDGEGGRPVAHGVPSTSGGAGF